MFARMLTPLALLSFACSMGAISQASAQTTGVAAPARSAGTPLRQVSATGSMQLVYEYDAPGGKERLVIDPGSLLSDIRRVRARAEARPPVAKIVSIAPVETAAREAEPAPAPAKAHAALNETPAPVAATGERAPRKVRIIPLFNVPKED